MTKIYGDSDDLIEFEGDFTGEFGCYGTDESDGGALIIVSDGTMLAIAYGKNGDGVWGIKTIKTGDLFDGIVVCNDSDADPYSDVAHFKDGVKWCIACKNWEKVS